MEVKKHSVIILGSLIFGAFFAGASTLFVRLSELGPISSGFQRAFLAIPILWVWVICERYKEPSKGIWLAQKDLLLVILAGTFFAGDLFFWHLSIVNTTVANATLLATLSPIFVTIGMFLFFREIPSIVFVLGVFIALVGAGALIGNSAWFHQDQMLGNIYGLVTGVFFAAYLITVSCVRERLSAASVMYYSTIVTAIILLPFALILEGNIFPHSLNGWVILLALAGFSHVGGQGLIAFALAYLGASFSAVTLILEVVTATLLGWLFLSESIEMLQWCGGVIIVLGIMIAKRGSSE